MAEVSLRDISKTYAGGATAVDSLSLDIADGLFVVLVGPSGCGKTTTLRLIAGLEKADRGTIRIAGHEVDHQPPRDRDVAMVFQDSALYPHMTVRQNMAFGLKMRGVPKDQIDGRVAETADVLGISDLLARKPGDLSGGQRQRVALGRAIVRRPNVFLFDEPLSNLDARLRASMRTELKSLHQRFKTTSIYVTHDQEEAMTLGDLIVVMRHGVVQQIGPPLHVYQQPANRFVASFIGSPPMNFLAGTLQRDGNHLIFVEGSNDPDGTPYRISLPPGERLSAFVGKPVTAGIRPQALRRASVEKSSEGSLPLRFVVRICEPLGDQMDLVCGTPKHPAIVARIATEKLSPGQTVVFTVDPGQVHVFEPGELGGNLSHHAGGFAERSSG